LVSIYCSILVRFVYYCILVLAIVFALAILGVPVSAILSVSSAALVVLAGGAHRGHCRLYFCGQCGHIGRDLVSRLPGQ